MPLIVWNDNLSVNVAEIDMQHKKLVTMINELNDAMKAMKTKEVLGKIIQGLLNYTATHFATEERYFKQYNYPGAPTHIQEHQIFVKKVTDFKKGFDENKFMLSMEIINFLKNWLIKHIQGTDKKYTEFFHQHGLK